MQGWVKLHRKLIESPIFKNANTLQVWMWCLLKASHRESRFIFNFDEQTLLPGQFISGRLIGSEDCNMNASTFWKNVKLLEKIGNITLKSNNRFTVFTVLKWAQYQIDEIKVTTKEQPSNSQVTAREQPSNTYKNVKNVKNEELESGTSEVQSEKCNTTKQSILYFCSKYKERTGVEYLVSWGRDGKIFKSILDTIPVETLEKKIDAYFSSRDEWIMRAGFTTAIFRSQVNKLNVVLKLPTQQTGPTWAQLEAQKIRVGND